MAKKRPAAYRRNKTVKSIARKRVGSPPPSRTIKEKPLRDKTKYKESWQEGSE